MGFLQNEALRGYAVACLVCAFAALAIRLLLPRILAWRGVSFWWHTRFGPALVFDSADADGTAVRLLNVNGTYQSVCYIDEDLLWYPVCAYHRTWCDAVDTTFAAQSKDTATETGEFAKASAPKAPRTASPSSPAYRALVLGGGGYSFPKWLVAFRPDFACETVEIDPAITTIARDRFFVDRLVEEFDTKRTGRLALVNDDAWAYLAQDDAGYDLIVNDVFTGNRPMGALGTREGAERIRAHLHPGGLYIANLRTPLEGRGAQTLTQTREVFGQVFSHVEFVPERPEEPHKKGNNTLLAWV